MKPTLILAPGLMCDATVWQGQIEALSSDWACHVPNYDHADSITEMAWQILDTAPERFALAGHSMGGRVAMEVCRLVPERVTHLALLDTAAHPLADGEAGQQEIAGRQRLVELAEGRGTRAMGETWVQGMVHPDRLSDSALINAILDMIGSKTVAVFKRQIHALIHRPDARTVLPTLTCPTTLLCGTHDTWSPLERHHDMARQIAGDQGRGNVVVPIADAGHMAPMERPDAVSAALRDWLTR